MTLTFKVVFLLLSLMLAFSEAAYAHGGVSIEQDRCVLAIGPYRVHFTGYQPEVSGGQEFCEDIPVAGKAIIVMDYVDEALRERDTSVKIVEKESWSSAQSTDGDEQAKAILDIAPKRYKRGSIKIDQTFTQPGYFVGFVTSKGSSPEDTLVSRFPFAVGYGAGGAVGQKAMTYGMYAVVAVLLLGTAYYFYRKQAMI